MKISIKREQNDACIGSAEREKFGTMFKNTFRFLSMAALLVVSAIMTGCSSDDNIDNPQQPANKDNVVTLTATVSLDGAAGTRAINPTSGVKIFESTNKIAVFYEDVDDKIQKAESGALTLSADKKKATFTVTLSNLKSGGDFRYVYPATMAKALDANPPAYPAYVDASLEDLTIDYSGLLGSQDGTLETIGTKYDLAVYDGSLAVTELPEWAPMGNPLAICKFTLKNGSTGITSSVNKLTICDCTNTYVVTPSSLSEIYVAMKPVNSGNISFAATTATNTYFKTKTGATLAASTLYTDITVSMVDAADLIVSPAVGQVIGDDGKNYADAAAATSAGATAVAKIVYVGSDNGEAAPYNHGLALALSDASTGCQWSTSTGSTVHTYNAASSTFTEESGLQYNDVTHNSDAYPAFKAAIANNGTAAPTGCSSWFLASGYQWKQMIGAAGLSNLGLSSDAVYWSSTEQSAGYAWWLYSKDGSWSRFYKDAGKEDPYKDYHVRACLAF